MLAAQVGRKYCNLKASACSSADSLDELDTMRAPLLQSPPAKDAFMAPEGGWFGRLLNGRKRETPDFAGKTWVGWT